MCLKPPTEVVEPPRRPRTTTTSTTNFRTLVVQPPPMAMPRQQAFLYMTLITRDDYLPGVILLAHSLRKQGAIYGLVVLYTNTVTDLTTTALEIEQERGNILGIKEIDHLIPPSRHEINVANPRFVDTWTKLRVFEQYEHNYRAICYLDADMLLLHNMDSIFDHTSRLPTTPLKAGAVTYGIAAVHDCVCSPDRDQYTPVDHVRKNCPFTNSTHPQCLTKPLEAGSSPRTYELFNSGMFLFRPTQALWMQIYKFFYSTDLLSTFRFPDQDFMVHFFKDKWVTVGYQYNGVKTMAYRHDEIWRDEDVINIHYIVDKPWNKRLSGLQPPKNRLSKAPWNDEHTHAWWWQEFERWVALRRGEGYNAVVDIVEKFVAPVAPVAPDPDFSRRAIQVAKKTPSPQEATYTGRALAAVVEAEPRFDSSPIQNKAEPRKASRANRNSWFLPPDNFANGRDDIFPPNARDDGFF